MAESKLQYADYLFRTRLLWAHRFGELGSRVTLGRKRLCPNPAARSSTKNIWMIQERNIRY